MIPFKAFVREANYGALQTDKRISYLRDKLLNQLVEAWMRERNTDVNVTALMYRDTGPDYEVLLRIISRQTSEEVPDHLIFFGGKTLNRPWRDSTENVIDIYISSKVDYTEAIKRVDDIKPLLSHELKHAMDNSDNRFGRNNMNSYIQHDGTNYKQYVTQIQEINNFLITVIEDLELVRKDNPDISFADALKRSWWWNHIYESALYDYGKLNKFKSKLAQYWNREKVITGRIDFDKQLRLQLMLLLYQWHKDGDIKKAKEKGMNVTDVLKQNIERMNSQTLRDNIAKFKKLLSERG